MLYQATTVFKHYQLVLEKLRAEIINKQLNVEDVFIDVEIRVATKTPGTELVCVSK